MGTATALKRALNYSSTYYLLAKDYVAYLGAKAFPVLSGVVAAALLYPLPFAIMAAAAYAMMAGHHTTVIKISRWKAAVDVDSAFLYALVLAGVTLTLNYFAVRLALNATTSWQTSLFWRAVTQLPAMARWDTQTVVPMPLRAERLGNFLTSLVRSGFLVGRIMTIGLSHFVMALGALIILAWLDPVSVAVLIAMAILWLPLYAWALLALIGIRQQNARKRQQQQTILKRVVDGVLSSSGRQIGNPQLSDGDARRLESGYALVNAQLQGLNLVSLILGLHVFSSIAVIYLFNGAEFSVFVRDKVVFFVVLLFMMKAALGLVSLISRLSRSYTNLATLRAYLHPRRKRVHRMPGAAASAIFSLRSEDGGERYPLSMGQPVFVIMPKASRPFELLPLSNALQILKMPEEPVLRHIVFLDTLELEAVINSGQQQPPVSTIETPDMKQIVQLQARTATLKRDELGVLALSQNAWAFLVESGETEDFCRNRIVFVVIAELSYPEPPSPETLLVVSDCVDIIAVGNFAETWERSAEDAFKRAASKETRIDFDEVEETA